MSYLKLDEGEKKALIRQYFEREIETIKRLNLDDIFAAAEAIWAAYMRDATVYIFGNGGSAATASHFVCDFNKGISEKKAKKFNLICLNDNSPMLMAIANDYSYDEIFYYPLKGRLKPTDLVIGISGSGNSTNVLRAVKYAKEIGAKVIGITGYDGGKLKELSDYHMDAMIDDMQIAEDIHMIFDHMLFHLFNNKELYQ